MNNETTNNEKVIIETKEQLDKVITASVRAVVNKFNIYDMRVRRGFHQMIIEGLYESCDIRINTVMCEHEYIDGRYEYWDEPVSSYISNTVMLRLMWTNPSRER